jgi:cytochrome c peroxidase
MRKMSPYKLTALFATIFVIVWGCKKLDLTIPNTNTPTDPFAATKLAFGTNINFDSLSNYANQTKPTYITQDNTGTNSITNAKATLGRVLFYDKNLRMQLKVNDMFEFFTASISLIRQRSLISARRN